MSPKTKAATQIRKQQSHVNAIDARGNVFKTFYVWSNVAPAVKANPSMLFAKCIVLPGSTKDLLKCKQIDPKDPADSVFDVKASSAYNYNANIDPATLADIGMLPHTNEAAILDYLRQRLTAGIIYSTADPLLVALNPFKDLKNTGQDYIQRYRDSKDASRLPPHIFTLAKTALEALHSVHKSQTIIVSGESGAGKTEAVKQVMRFFASGKSGSLDTRIQSAVLAANPVLEAFGNAKTLRNNNSSRFGRFMQLTLVQGGGIEYGSVRNFLLEKSRILTQDNDERSYHVFYQLLKGASSEQRSKFHLKGLTGYSFLNPKCTDVANVNDQEDFQELQQSLKSMMLSPDEIETILLIVSGVLLMGNVKLRGASKDGVPNAAEIDPSTSSIFDDACGLLALDPVLLKAALTQKITVVGKETIQGHHTLPDAEVLRGSLSKGMYDSLFSWIVSRLNNNIEPPSKSFSMFMGLLDIFGFEVFKNNSLEQLFINITNEMLQKNFIDIVFERETKLYQSEGISNAKLEWTSNEAVIKMLTEKKGSLMSTLEDQCLAPGGTDEGFLGACKQILKNNEKFVEATIGSNVNFVVRHTVGDIQYCVENFLFKNKDVLRAELVEVVQASVNPVVAKLYEGIVVERGKLAKGQLIGSQFLNQLQQLMDLINITEPHFVRCVKPNEEKAPLKFDAAKTIVQLQALSILEALQLKNLGYSYRRPFEEFLFQYRFVDLGVADNHSVPPQQRAEKLIKSGNVSEDEWRIGKTMVFMKPSAVKQLAEQQRNILSAWTPIVEIMEAQVQRRKLCRQYTGKLAQGCVRIQANARRVISSRGHTTATFQESDGRMMPLQRHVR